MDALLIASLSLQALLIASLSSQANGCTSDSLVIVTGSLLSQANGCTSDSLVNVHIPYSGKFSTWCKFRTKPQNENCKTFELRNFDIKFWTSNLARGSGKQAMSYFQP